MPAPRRRRGGLPPAPRARKPTPIKVAAPPTIAPVLQDIVTRTRRSAQVNAFSNQSQARAKAMGSDRNRATIPSAEDLFGPAEDLFASAEGSGAYDRSVLGNSTAGEQRARAADVTRYVSPAPTMFPNRPRSLEYKYDPARLVLTVTFRDGGTYEYFDVDRRTFYNMARVKSTGRFIDRNIKGYFKYKKVGV